MAWQASRTDLQLHLTFFQLALSSQQAGTAGFLLDGLGEGRILCSGHKNVFCIVRVPSQGEPGARNQAKVLADFWVVSSAFHSENAQFNKLA